MTDAPIDIQVRDKVSANIAKKIRDIGEASRSTFSAVEELQRSLMGFRAVREISEASRSTRHLTRDIQQATRASRELAQTTVNGSQAFNRGTVAANTYRSALTRASTATTTLRTNSTALSGAMGQLVGLFASVFAVQYYAGAQDALTNIQNKLRTVTDTSQELADTQRTLFDLANRTRSGVESTVQAYVRFTNVLSSIGVEQEEVLRIVETINKATIVAGTNASEAAGAIRQFLQGIQNGALRGEEFNSVMEQMPVQIIDAIANEMGVAREELRGMAEQGLITAEVLRNALGGAAPIIDELFARTVPTINNAMTMLSNKFIEFTADSAAGAQFVAQAIIMVGDNLNLIIPTIAAFAAAWAAVKAGAIIMSLVQALVVLGSVLVAHPILLLAGVLLATAAAVLYMTGNLDGFINALKDGVSKMAGLNTETESLGGTLEAGGDNSATLADSLVRVGGEGTPAIETADRAINTMSITTLSAADSAALLATNLWEAVDAANALNAANSNRSGGTANEAASDLPGFNSGASFRVGGRQGVDKNLVAFRATRGERVKVQTRQQQREEAEGGSKVNNNNVNITIVTPDIDSFRRSQSQIMGDLKAAMVA